MFWGGSDGHGKKGNKYEKKEMNYYGGNDGDDKGLDTWPNPVHVKQAFALC